MLKAYQMALTGLLGGFALFLWIAAEALAKEIPYTLEDRERLIRVETKLDEMAKRFEQRFEQIDKRFEQIDKRFEQVDKRFEQIDKRFDQIDHRFNQMSTLFLGIVGAFAAIVAVTIGFAIWDRRTMIRPFETRMKALEEEKVDRLIGVLRDLAQVDTKVADALRRHHLL